MNRSDLLDITFEINHPDALLRVVRRLIEGRIAFACKLEHEDEVDQIWSVTVRRDDERHLMDAMAAR